MRMHFDELDEVLDIIYPYDRGPGETPAKYKKRKKSEFYMNQLDQPFWDDDL